MTRFLGALVAALVAGACLGLFSDWVSSSGGWDEMHLGASAARSAAWFVAAFLVAAAVRRRGGFGAIFAVPTTCMLGAALFGSIGYMDDGWVEVEPGRVLLFAVFTLCRSWPGSSPSRRGSCALRGGLRPPICLVRPEARSPIAEPILAPAAHLPGWRRST
jgi:hypothetical protein